MNNPLYYTPEEAEQRLRSFGGGPSAEAMRAQAQNNYGALGFPVCVIGRRLYIPRRSFDAFWGLAPERVEKDAEAAG